ncbi:MAG: aromatic ring hydroxylase [Deltaproteobacteria bacterium]|nr:aromatic ring hydroxylase [Deltaproteobacteria bacterium]
MRTPEEYCSSLNKMKRNVYIGGDKVGRDDPRLLGNLKVMQTTFQLAQNTDWEGVITAESSITGKIINRFTHLAQNPLDLIKKQKMIRLTATRVGGCIQRCMGQDAIAALSVATKEMDEKLDTEYHQRFMSYLREYQERDWAGACCQTDSKGDRIKRPHEQEDPDAYVHIVEEKSDGIVVSGLKISITMAAVADELLVIPTRALTEKDRYYAVAFAIPADWENVRLITRPAGLRERKKFKCPYTEMGVSESVVVFDNAFIPKERVFMCGEWKFGRRIALLFANSHRFSYTGCKPAVSDVLCGTAALAAEANNIERVSHVTQKLSEIVGTGELAFAAGIAAALYGEKTSSGTFTPNETYANVGRRLMGEFIYHEFNILTEIAGGLSVTLPFEDDFLQEVTKKDLEKLMKRNPQMSYEDACRVWRFVENVAASSMASWYQIAGVHGGGSPIMETIALNIETDYESKKNVAKYLAGINEELDQSKQLKSMPCDLS